MIERKIIEQTVREFQIEEYIKNNLKRVGYSHSKVQKTPLGDKIIIHASRPGLIVGRQGSNIKRLTADLKNKFNMENPQVEISEVENPDLDANIVAERIVNSLERYGHQRFKGIGHKVMEDVMRTGALGVEILISGKIPSDRAKAWRFYQGYLKKCGDIAITQVDKCYKAAHLKIGSVGIKVSIMPPDIKLPDDIKLVEEKQEVVEEVKEEEIKKEIEEETEALKEIKEKMKEKESKDTKKESKKSTKKTSKQKVKKKEDNDKKTAKKDTKKEKKKTTKKKKSKK
jgi:small subunit ribosomal protein S3